MEIYIGICIHNDADCTHMYVSFRMPEINQNSTTQSESSQKQLPYLIRYMWDSFWR